MDTPLTTTDLLDAAISAALATGSGKWTGCDWPTQFGRSRLDLNGLRPSQALLMERATAGNEAAIWRDAVVWLRQVGEDAQLAEIEAQAAACLARSGRLSEALERIQRACAIEARYHTSLVWQPLCTAIEAAAYEGNGKKALGQPPPG